MTVRLATLFSLGCILASFANAQPGHCPPECVYQPAFPPYGCWCPDDFRRLLTRGIKPSGQSHSQSPAARRSATMRPQNDCPPECPIYPYPPYGCLCPDAVNGRRNLKPLGQEKRTSHFESTAARTLAMMRPQNDCPPECPIYPYPPYGCLCPDAIGGRRNLKPHSGKKSRIVCPPRCFNSGYFCICPGHDKEDESKGDGGLDEIEW